MSDGEEIKLYFDYKSPYAYLSKDEAFALPGAFRVKVRWIPFILRIKGKGERSLYSEYKARYSYMDARRWANKQGSWTIKGPLKVYDSVPALIGGLYAQREGFFRDYTDLVFTRFFKRELEIDVPAEIAAVMEELGRDGSGYTAYLSGEGADLFERCQTEAAEDHAFGVPLFMFRGEQFWGRDRIDMLKDRLSEAGLARSS